MSYNKIILLGNLTRDPELSYLPSQTAVCNFGIATNRKWTGKDGQQKEEVCFVDCVAFGKIAETLNKYLHKGESVLIEGRLKFESWQAKDGSKRNKHKVVVETFTFVGQKQSEAGQTREPVGRDEGPGGDVPF